jgi:hypothetical protein
MTEDLSKLLHGFARGRLSDDEKQFLAEAAMADQEVFDAVLESQILKDLMEEPGSVQALTTDAIISNPERNLKTTFEKARQKLRDVVDRIAPSKEGLTGGLNPEPAYGLTEGEEQGRGVQGRIVAVSDNVITLDIGVDAGLCVGDHLAVYQREKEIGVLILRTVDEQNATGRFLGAGVPMIGDTVVGTRQ